MFNGMPEEIWPNQSEHIEYEIVYRATKSTDSLTESDFLPWNIEFPDRFQHKLKQFKGLCDRSAYGVSLFLTKNDLLKALNKYPNLDANTKSFSIGSTTIDRGISTKASASGHIDYYLYDYESNNPKDDFNIEEVK